MLVNNAGVAHQAPLVDYALEDYRAVLDVNQVGVFLGMRTAARMMQGRGGSIVNISSLAVLEAYPYVGYKTMKTAVIALTSAMILSITFVPAMVALVFRKPVRAKRNPLVQKILLL